MPQPTPYTPATDFSDDELANAGGRSTVRTAAIDAEFSAIEATLDGVLTNLALNQRDDGEIRDARVKLHTLATDVRALLAAGQGLPRGAWLTGTAYALRDLVTQAGITYICAVAHTSGTFAADLAAGRWLVLSLNTPATAAGVPFTPTADVPATDTQAAVESVSDSLVDFVDSLAGSTGAALVGSIQTGAGATARTVQDKLRERVSLGDFGAVKDDSGSSAKAANTAAILAAIASFPEVATAALDPAYSVAGEIEVAPGTYWFSARLDLRRSVMIRARGGFPSGNSFGPVRFVFPDNDHGIVIHNYVTSGTGKGADGTVLQGISVIPASYAASGTTPASASYHGIWMRTRAHLRGVQSSGWPGNGIQVIATAGAGGDLEGNANSWSADAIVVQQNGMNGLYISGADVNASYVGAVDARANRRCGIRDNSFLGVTIDAPHTSSNGSAGLVSHGGKHWYCLSDTLGGSTTPGTDATVWGDMGAGSSFAAWSGSASYYIGAPYWLENANSRSQINAGYSESGQGGSVVKLPAQVFGGLHASGNPSGFGFDPTLSTAPFWDTDLAGAILRYAHLVPSKGLNFAAAKITRSADADTLDAYTESVTHTPTSSGITTTGTITYGWQATRIGNRVDFRITIGVTAGTNAYTAGTSYVTLPAGLTPTAGAACVATTTAVAQVGICYIGSDARVYLPTWSASSATVIVSGSYFVSSTAA